MTSGRRQKATGGRTRRVDRAIQLYRRLWARDARRMTLDRRTVASGGLIALLETMTPQELADYYTTIRGIE